MKLYKNQITTLISEPDNGIYNALNKGLKLATGDIVGVLHSDDHFFDKRVIESIINTFTKNKSIEMLFGNVIFFSNEKSFFHKRIYSAKRFKPWMLRFGFMPPHTATFIKRDLIKKIGLYDENYKSASDFDYILRALHVCKAKYYILNQPMIFMKLGGMSTSGMKSYIRTSFEIRKILVKNKIYSNWLFILIRLPVKLLNIVYNRIKKKHIYNN